MNDIILLSLALWIVTHTIAREIPLTANARKPFSCQLCLAGWTCIAVSAIYYTDVWGALEVLSVWALSVIIEAVYDRLHIVVM